MKWWREFLGAPIARRHKVADSSDKHDARWQDLSARWLCSRMRCLRSEVLQALVWRRMHWYTGRGCAIALIARILGRSKQAWKPRHEWIGRCGNGPAARLSASAAGKVSHRSMRLEYLRALSDVEARFSGEVAELQVRDRLDRRANLIRQSQPTGAMGEPTRVSCRPFAARQRHNTEASCCR